MATIGTFSSPFATVSFPFATSVFRVSLHDQDGEV
jgi:hypothetical protein